MAALPEVGTAPSEGGPAGGIPVELEPPSWWKRKGYTAGTLLLPLSSLPPASSTS